MPTARLLEKSSLNGFSVIEPSQIEEIFTYIPLNIPVTCPPRATFLGQRRGNPQPI
jgi:hypothetical protein